MKIRPWYDAYQKAYEGLEKAREYNRYYGEGYWKEEQYVYVILSDDKKTLDKKKLEATYQYYNYAIAFIKASLNELRNCVMEVQWEKSEQLQNMIWLLIKLFDASDAYNLCFCANRENIKILYDLVEQCLLMRNKEAFYGLHLQSQQTIKLNELVNAILEAFGQNFYRKCMKQELELGDTEEVFIDEFYTKFVKERTETYGKTEGEQASFYSYFYQTWQLRKNDIYKSKRIQAKKTAFQLDEENKEESKEKEIPVYDKQLDYVHENDLILEKFFYTIGNCIIEMYEHINLKMKQGKLPGAFYFKLFHTEKITLSIKEDRVGIDVYCRYKDELFRVLDNEFLNYYMQGICKTLSDILCRNYKKWVKITNREIEKGRSEKQFEAKVFINYLEEEFKKKVSDPWISKKRKEYRELLVKVKKIEENKEEI